MRTQLELLQSRAIAERVANSLKLGEDADFLKPRDFSILGGLRGLVGFGAAAKPRRRQAISSPTRLLQRASFSATARCASSPARGWSISPTLDPNPARAQRIANSYGEMFIASALDKRFQANCVRQDVPRGPGQSAQGPARGLREGDARVRRERADHHRQRARVDRRVQPDRGQHVALGVLVSERIKAEQLWKQLDNATGMNLPQILTNKSIEDLRQRRGQLVTEYQEKLETFKPSYPGDDADREQDQGDRPAACSRGRRDQDLAARRIRCLAQPGKGDEGADRGAARRGARPAEAQHPVQHSEARRRHDPHALQQPAAALQGGRRRRRRRHQQHFRGRSRAGVGLSRPPRSCHARCCFRWCLAWASAWRRPTSWSASTTTSARPTSWSACPVSSISASSRASRPTSVDGCPQRSALGHCPRPIARFAPACSSPPTTACPRRWSSRRPAPRKASRRRRWSSPSTSPAAASRCCWSTPICAIPPCTRRWGWRTASASATT